MKNILKYITVFTFFIVAAFSCRNEDEVRMPELQRGVGARVILYPDRSFINLDDINNASVAFDVYTTNDDIEEIVYTANFVDADSTALQFPTITAFTVPGNSFVKGKVTELEISAEKLAEQFGLPGGVSYFEGGDNVTFNATAKLKDGRVISGANSAPSITGGAAASFTSQFVTYVGCPSNANAIVGTYYSIMEYNNFDLSIGDTVEVQVTFAGPEPFRYQVSDHTVKLYVPFGGPSAGYPATFYDLCGTAILQPATSFGNVVNLDQSADPNLLSPQIVFDGDKVEFVLNWFETNNEIAATVRFVKKI